MFTGPVPLLEPDRTGHEPNAVAWASRDALRFDQNEKVRFDGKRGVRVAKLEREVSGYLGVI